MSLIRPGLSAIKKMAPKAAEKAMQRPFYSAVDKAITEITAKQPKGTGDQYLAMILKTKGVKPAEVKDRGLDVALKGKGKVSGEELQKLADENPPPQVKERVLDDSEVDYLSDDAEPTITNPTHYGPEEYKDYQTPGGENYREVLFHLPEPKVKQVAPRTLAELQSQGLHVTDFEYNKYTNQASYIIRDADNNFVAKSSGARGVSAPEQALIKYGIDSANMDQSDIKKASTFSAPHFGGNNKQLLAHARVQDMTGPNGEKIMVIDEIQSDWHQQGRKKGYRTEEVENKYKEAEQQYIDYKNSLDGRLYEKMISHGMDEKEALNIATNLDPLTKAGLLGEGEKYRELVNYQRFDPDNLPPDAPFKKNWHELVMKRLMDDAVKGGYDRVIITPGAEQAKRYDLSSHVDKLVYHDNSQYLMAIKNGEQKLIEKVPPEKLHEYVGQETADKLLAQTPYESKRVGETTERILSGLDLEIGGEGMKGFYDKILPSYIKSQYGVELGQHPLRLREFDVVTANGGEGFAVVPKGEGRTIAKYPTMEEAQAAADQMSNVPYHSFDITPEMRESITTQGQPLYQLAPVAGAVGAGMMATEEEPEQYRKGGVVRTPVSMDAMRLATLNKQRKRKYG
jgi:hypothetical protein